MPDITMCKDNDCNLKETCYRYTAKPSEYQYYFVDSPKGEDGKCDYYWGLSQVSIFEQLEEIVKPKLDKKIKK